MPGRKERRDFQEYCRGYDLLQKRDEHIREAERVAAIITRKEADMQARGRCARCWHHHGRCICELIKPLTFKLDVRFYLYVHWREWYSAGDDAKLLVGAAPDLTELFVYGRPGDDERLRALLASPCDALLLFPDDSAISVEEFVARREARRRERAEGSEIDGGAAGGDAAARREGALAADSTPREADASSGDGRVPIIIVVVDSTWQPARKMAHHLDSLGLSLPHVKLETELVSVYARTQTQIGRICTVEAIGLLLQQLGEDPGVFASLIEYIQHNNHALANVQANRNRPLWEEGPDDGDPAWYFGPKTKRAEARV